MNMNTTSSMGMNSSDMGMNRSRMGMHTSGMGMNASGIGMNRSGGSISASAFHNQPIGSSIKVSESPFLRTDEAIKVGMVAEKTIPTHSFQSASNQHAPMKVTSLSCSTASSFQQKLWEPKPSPSNPEWDKIWDRDREVFVWERVWRKLI